MFPPVLLAAFAPYALLQSIVQPSIAVGVILGTLGISAIALGLKGFTASGIPLHEGKRIMGRAAKTWGVVAIVLGVAVIGAGFYLGWLMDTTP